MSIIQTPPRSEAPDSRSAVLEAADGRSGAVRSRRAGALLIGASVALVPWTLALWARLPGEGASATGRLLWVALDGLEVLLLLGSGILVRRGSRWQSIPLALTGALLLADAGIDVLTSGSTERGWALALLAIELPLAAWCLRRASSTRACRASVSEVEGQVDDG